MNKLQRKTLFMIVATACTSFLSGCASTVQPQTRHFQLTSNMLPVCESRAPLAPMSGDNETDAVPVVAIAPQYPNEAFYRRLDGVVVLQFSIDAHGVPCDVALAFSAPDGLFVRAAVAALIRSKFKPRSVNGQPVTSRATFSYRFQMPGKLRRKHRKLPDVAPSPTTPVYPMAAWLDHVEGFVTLGFTVDTDGRPESIVVRESKPKGVFDRAAARALMHSQFKIRRFDGKAIPYEATFTYRFKLAPQHQKKKAQDAREGTSI